MSDPVGISMEEAADLVKLAMDLAIRDSPEGFLLIRGSWIGDKFFPVIERLSCEQCIAIRHYLQNF